MLDKTIKSRPVYGRLALRRGRRHLFVVDLAGIHAILDNASGFTEGFFRQSSVVVVETNGERRDVESLVPLAPESLIRAPSLDACLPRLTQLLANAPMGTTLYLAGTESLIGRCTSLAMSLGMQQAAIVTEHRGSTARRMQCVHCKGYSENVRTQPATCSHCGLLLLVRDHYSKRLAAFQGVCINAEDFGMPQTTEEVFS